MFEILSVVDEGLGHSSYVVGLGDGTALVIDPARFPTGQRDVARARGWRVAWTTDTHSHADYISGSPELASTGATFLAPRGARLEVAHTPVDPGDEIPLAEGITLKALATPGHTPEHLAYLLMHHGKPAALFSGGSLMVGALGRTDLLGSDRRDGLTRQLYQAIQRNILTLPDDLPVYPTHGAGSFCAAPAGAERTTTIGHERSSNALLAIDDEDTFVRTMVAGLGSFPDYFRVLPGINQRGPRLYPNVPDLPRLGAEEVKQLLDGGAVMVDARPISDFATAHPSGAISIEHRPAFASWLGWLIGLDRPVVFVINDDTDRTNLMRQCFRIGHEAIAGELNGGLNTWQEAGYPVSTIALVDPDAMNPTVLDIRQDAEWNAGHLPAAVHVELGSLAEFSPAAGGLTVMCGHGERAMTGASILAANGHSDVTVLNGGPDDWERLTGTALATT